MQKGDNLLAQADSSFSVIPFGTVLAANINVHSVIFGGRKNLEKLPFT